MERGADSASANARAVFRLLIKRGADSASASARAVFGFSGTNRGGQCWITDMLVDRREADRVWI